jgi:phosphatidylinositol-3-phosphatase
LASNFYAESHPSLPNYIAMTSGSTQRIGDDDPPAAHPLDVPSIFSLLPGGGSRPLQESMPSNCLQTDSGEYAVRHNPQAYYVNLAGDCARYNVPLSDPPDLSARFTFVTPNLIHDMHDGTVADGDTWLSSFVPELLSSAEYGPPLDAPRHPGDARARAVARRPCSPRDAEPRQCRPAESG